ncbi:oxidoreductase [Paraferrimonas haliotis]|uniref:Oxidoreductase n=2 Tax=Paraferrimonas haliotis TaxID=2013866 RepID=A0AA37TUH0_9GAMM|nr:oxidoreductase [Paraferrimonas haliotis]
MILITGSTDGIGLLTASKLLELGHKVIVHGRNPSKLEQVKLQLSDKFGKPVLGYNADLSSIGETMRLADQVSMLHGELDVLINNAGIYSGGDTTTVDGLDVRFAVNTVAPYILTERLQPIMNPGCRVINLSSAAQAPVDLAALNGERALSAGEAYAQSKLALTMWTRAIAPEHEQQSHMLVSVNPGSLLGSKMVKENFGIAGGDMNVGADILVKAATSEEFASAHGLYFDNDSGRFANAHPDSLSDDKCNAVVAAIESIIQRH